MRERVASTYAGVEEKGDDDVEELGELLGAQRVHDLDVRRQLGVDLLLAAHEASHGARATESLPAPENEFRNEVLRTSASSRLSLFYCPVANR